MTPCTYTLKGQLGNWMYSAGPLGPTGKKSAELIGDLFLVGTRGKCCAVLTDRQLTIERFDGRGIRLGLGAIDRMRHLKAPILPSGTILLGLLAIYLGVTTIVHPWKWVTIGIGISCLIGNAISRYSILAIETSNGDRHLISGNEGSLLKLCLMVDRVRHGSSIDEATIGLESLETELPFFPALSDAKGSIGKDENLTPLGSDIGLLPLPPKTEEFPAEQMPQNNLMGFFDNLDGAGKNFADSAEDVVPAAEESVTPKLNAYERAWGGRQAPPWYSEKSLDSESKGRMDTALSDAAQGLDLFANGGLFDTEYSEKEPNDGTMDGWDSGFEEVNDGIPNSLSRSSSQMIKMAHDKFGAPDKPFSRAILPPPTEEAVREECRAGIVKQARAKQELRAKMQSNFSRPGNLEDYPALNRLVASTMVSSRIDMRGVSGSSQTGSWLSRLLKPRNDVAKRSRANDEFSKTPSSSFQTAQRMRLRSDQDHQTKVGSMVGNTERPSPGGSAKDTLDLIVERMAKGEEPVPKILASQGESLRFSQLKATSSVEDPHPIPGLRRLG